MIKKRPKYGNKKVIVDGILFDSKKEGMRWLVLKDALVNGTITDLERQVKVELIPQIKEEVVKHLKTKDKIEMRVAQKAINYVCDFRYFKNGQEIFEDVKASPKTASLDKVFLLKEKLFFWKFGFSIKRVYDAEDPI